MLLTASLNPHEGIKDAPCQPEGQAAIGKGDPSVNAATRRTKRAAKIERMRAKGAIATCMNGPRRVVTLSTAVLHGIPEPFQRSNPESPGLWFAALVIELAAAAGREALLWRAAPVRAAH